MSRWSRGQDKSGFVVRDVSKLEGVLNALSDMGCSANNTLKGAYWVSGRALVDKMHLE